MPASEFWNAFADISYLGTCYSTVRASLHTTGNSPDSPWTVLGVIPVRRNRAHPHPQRLGIVSCHSSLPESTWSGFQAAKLSRFIFLVTTVGGPSIVKPSHRKSGRMIITYRIILVSSGVGADSSTIELYYCRSNFNSFLPAPCMLLYSTVHAFPL